MTYSWALGIFDYYTAHLSGVLKFLSYLLIHPGDKEEGLRKLTLAAKEATYSATEAKSVLLHNYLFLEEDFKKAMDLADQLTRQYPRDHRYWLLLGVCQVRLQMEEETQRTIEFLRDRSKDPAFTPQEQAVWLRRCIYLEGIRDAYAGTFRGLGPGSAPLWTIPTRARSCHGGVAHVEDRHVLRP